MSNQLKSFLTPELKEIFVDGERLQVSPIDGLFDYSYLVFPYAKGFEGFLKLLFYRAQIITQFQYESDRWRVGKALNPNLEAQYRGAESAYDRLVTNCSNGKELADKIWDVWKKGRNTLFHFFPKDYKKINLGQAKNIILEIEETMELALSNCKLIDQKGKQW